MRVSDWIYNQYRRLFGRYEIIDPRPLAKEHPYTFFLPSEKDLSLLKPGNVAKLNFRGIPESREWDSERMWVLITGQGPDKWTGTLDNNPNDLPQLRSGDIIRFHPWQIIQTSAAETGDDPDDREYWERCFVDPLILSGEARVEFIEREEPTELEPGDRFPDSGWRIYGRDVQLPEGSPDVELEMDYVAIGAVLNRDDSWLHLIDEPVGASYRRNGDCWEEYRPT